MRLLSLMVLLAALLGQAPARAQVAADTPTRCDSCSIRVDSLAAPTRLVGRWLFTRDDSPSNAAVDDAQAGTADTAKWRLVKAPGPWKHAYDDKKNFTVGWYRGAFDFAPSLVGQDVVVLVNAYLGRVRVYVDGKEVYERPRDANVQRYYAIQPIPVRFRVTAPHQVIAIRVETPLMTGIYMLPFELRRYDPHDATLVFYQVWGGELRLVVGFVVAFFGLFFLLVYGKTKAPMYLTAALASLVIVPFFAGPTDMMASLVAPETLTYLHYFGLYAGFFSYLFCQFFHRFTPRINKIGGGLMGTMALLIAGMAIHPDVDLFQHVRGLYFIVMLAFGLGSLYMLASGVRTRRPGAGILLFGMCCFIASGVNDLLLALGEVATISMIFTGLSVFVGSMLYVASSAFANTFLENRRLVTELTGLNENLEGLVAERTLALRRKTADIQSMLQNMPQGVLTIVDGKRIHPEYSAYLETIFETTDIAGRDVMALVFAGASLGADALSCIDATIASCIGEDAMNFEFNAHLLATGFDIALADGRRKSLELGWSPIVAEDGTVDKLMCCVRDVTELRRLASEASAQKRELEIIGEILAVSQEKFQDFMQSALAFVDENRALTESAQGADAEVVARLFRNMHTVKGNARTYGLGTLTNAVHESEQAYDDLRQGRGAGWDAPALLARLAEVRTLLDEYARINDLKLGRKGPGRRGPVERFLMVEKTQVAQTLETIDAADANDLASLRDALAQTRQLLRRIGTEPLPDVLAGVTDSLPSLARELGKEPPLVAIRDQGIAVRNQAAPLLKNLFTHLLRNAIDHGIEAPPARLAAGKPPRGRIELDVALSDATLMLALRDDGRGMALERIRHIAVERGLVAADAKLADEQVAQLVFLPGFSTAEVVTEVSGRGVGMDAVQGFLEEQGGHVDVRFLGARTASGHRPFEFVITLPAGLAVGGPVVAGATTGAADDAPEAGVSIATQPAVS